MTAREPTLLVFTLSPAGESARRRLLPKRFGHLERMLHRRSLDAALSAGRTNRCRLEVSSPHPVALDPDVELVGQSGRAFGERFRDAVRAARGRAEGPLLVVGSDAPGLTGGHVTQALERLGEDRGRVVVGPSLDGGFYLLATNRPLDAELAHVRWCSRDTLRTLLAALHASGLEVSMLEPLRDLDRVRDLMAWLATEARFSPSWRSYASTLYRLFARLRRPPMPPSVGCVAIGHRPAFAGRAPPR